MNITEELYNVNNFLVGGSMLTVQVDDARLDGVLRARGVHPLLQPHKALLRRPRRGGKPKQANVLP